MTSRSISKAAEEEQVRRFRDAGRNVERPSCYREAQFDEHGHLLPSTAKELRETAVIRAARGNNTGSSLLSQYQTPTIEWSNGKEKVQLIETRIAIATGADASELTTRLATFRKEQGSVKLGALPIEIYVGILIAGLMERSPSDVTRAALAVFHPFGLYTLLSIDVPQVEPKPRTSSDVKKVRRDLKHFLELLPVLREYGARVIEPQVLTVVLRRLHQTLEARMIDTLAVQERQRRSRDMRPTLSTGWSTGAVERRRKLLAMLVRGLRAAEPEDWPISRIAALLFACERDWTLCPCPEFITKYRDRPTALEDLLKKDLLRLDSAIPLSNARSAPERRSRAEKRQVVGRSRV